MVVPVMNMQGVEVSKLTIDESQLGGELNPALIKQAYVMYHAALRQGSARSLNRHNVEGSTRKIIKQKGTGGARHGDRKVPHFRGGGHAHSKKRTREDFRLDMPTKMRRKANLNALLAKLVDNEVKVIDGLSMLAPKTKDFVQFLENIKVDKSALIALPLNEDNVRRSARNLDGVTLTVSNQLNCFQLLNHRYLVITKADLQALLSGPQAQFTKAAKVNPLGRDPARAEAAKSEAAKPKAMKRSAQKRAAGLLKPRPAKAAAAE
jgi:large subunit ribosomal protein L4